MVWRDVEIPSWIQALDALQKLGVDRHHVGDQTMHGTGLFHVHLVVALHNLRANFSGFTLEKHFPVDLAAEDLLANLLHALRAEGIGFARKSQRRKTSRLLFRHIRGGPCGMKSA